MIKYSNNTPIYLIMLLLTLYFDTNPISPNILYTYGNDRGNIYLSSELINNNILIITTEYLLPYSSLGKLKCILLNQNLEVEEKFFLDPITNEGYEYYVYSYLPPTITCLDKYDNLYIVGSCSLLNNDGKSDDTITYCAKYDSSYNKIFFIVFESEYIPEGICCDDSENIYLLFTFDEYTGDYGQYYKESANIIKLSKKGNIIWEELLLEKELSLDVSNILLGRDYLYISAVKYLTGLSPIGVDDTNKGLYLVRIEPNSGDQFWDLLNHKAISSLEIYSENNNIIVTGTHKTKLYIEYIYGESKKWMNYIETNNYIEINDVGGYASKYFITGHFPEGNSDSKLRTDSQLKLYQVEDNDISEIQINIISSYIEGEKMFFNDNKMIIIGEFSGELKYKSRRGIYAKISSKGGRDIFVTEIDI